MMEALMNWLRGKKKDAPEKKRRCMDLHDTLSGIQTTSTDLSKQVQEALMKKPANAGNGK